MLVELLQQASLNWSVLVNYKIKQGLMLSQIKIMDFIASFESLFGLQTS